MHNAIRAALFLPVWLLIVYQLTTFAAIFVGKAPPILLCWTFG
jgi:hypothetical protein